MRDPPFPLGDLMPKRGGKNITSKTLGRRGDLMTSKCLRFCDFNQRLSVDHACRCFDLGCFELGHFFKQSQIAQPSSNHIKTCAMHAKSARLTVGLGLVGFLGRRCEQLRLAPDDVDDDSVADGDDAGRNDEEGHGDQGHVELQQREVRVKVT